MKKIIAILAAGTLLAGAASAQSLGSILGGLAGGSGSDILKTASKVVYGLTGGNANSVSLPGTWTYTGSAVSLGGDNVLSNVAGSAVSSGVESKVDDYLKMIGVTSGAMTFTFNEDLTFTCTVRGIPVGGTWKTLDDGSKIQLQFGKAFKYMSITGNLVKTLDGCQMLFEGTKFLSLMKTILTYVGKQNATAGAISSLAGNYSSMKIGMTLKRTK